jgi:hypothetical protein
MSGRKMQAEFPPAAPTGGVSSSLSAALRGALRAKATGYRTIPDAIRVMF